MAGREISESRRVWLTEELAVWRKAEILGDDQATQIESLYETHGQSAQRRTSRAMFTLMGVAAFLVGLAVLLLIGYNWDGMPRPAKVATVFVVVLDTYGAAFWTRYVRRAHLPSELLFFLACIFYGSGIWLIAQAFHIQSHWPNGFWIWAIGVLPFALCLDTLLLHALFVALLAIWVGAEVIGFPERIGWGFTVNGAYTLPLLVLPGMLWAYAKRSPLAIALYVPLAVWWVVLQPVAWQATEQSVYVVGAVGAALLLLAEAHRPGDPMGVPFRFWGTAVSAGVLVPLSFADVIYELQFPHGSGAVTALTICILGGIGVVALAVFRSARSVPRDSDQGGLAAFAARQWFPVMMLALMAFLAIWNSNVTHAEPRYYHGGFDRWTPAVLLPTLMTNIALIALAIHLIRVGLNEDRGRPFTFGVLLFLLWAVLRYVDLFAGVGGMLGSAVMFLICGVALFAVARFWQGRKETPHV
ncbi:MAG: DUF2157 domain-containing protein [Thermoguttaceae bacterium]